MSSQILNFTPKRELLQVEDGKVVTLKYALFDADTEELIEYRDQFSYLHGGKQNELSKLQQALAGCKLGMKRDVLLQAQDAFGLQNPGLLLLEPETQFPPEYRQIGARIEAETDDGNSLWFTVTAVADGTLSLDGNHPLAGRNVKFVIEIIDLRDATGDELEVGCVVGSKPTASPPDKKTH